MDYYIEVDLSQSYLPHLKGTIFGLIIVFVTLGMPCAGNIGKYGLYSLTPALEPSSICDIDEYTKAENCSFGSYKYNPNPEVCPDREVCFLDPCKGNLRGPRCARELTCTCGSCMNCVGGVCLLLLCR